MFSIHHKVISSEVRSCYVRFASLLWMKFDLNTILSFMKDEIYTAYLCVRKYKVNPIGVGHYHQDFYIFVWIVAPRMRIIYCYKMLVWLGNFYESIDTVDWCIDHDEYNIYDQQDIMNKRNIYIYIYIFKKGFGGIISMITPHHLNIKFYQLTSL